MKKKKDLQLVILTTLVVLLIASLWLLSQIQNTEILRLQFADPKADVEKAIRVNDFRFVGLGGFVGTVPGNSQFYQLSRITGVKYVEGTGDADRHILYDRLIGKVRKYAEQYNAMLARHINSGGSDSIITRLRLQRRNRDTT